MNLLMRAIFSLLLLFTLSIPVISDCVAMAIESRFKYILGPTCARTDTLTPSSYCCH